MWELPERCARLFDRAVTENDIAQCQSALGVEFPEQYREFLTVLNGIRVTTGTIDVSPIERIDESDLVRLSCMYGVDANDINDVVRAQSDYQFHERVPPNFVAIGTLIGIGKLVIDVDTTQGELLMWDPGIPFEDGPNEPTEEWLTFVSPSLSEFWEKLG